MQELEVVEAFKGPYEKLSNFYPCIILYENKTYATIEHAYVASKSLDEGFRKSISEMDSTTPGIAKKMGRKVKLRPNWDLMKLSVMRNFLIQKFSYDEFKTLLLSTNDKILVEGNYWHDNYWGNCYCKKCKSIIGQNNLGKLIMKVRTLV